MFETIAGLYLMLVVFCALSFSVNLKLAINLVSMLLPDRLLTGRTSCLCLFCSVIQSKYL